MTAVHTKKQRYSMFRAIRRSLDLGGHLDGLEGEISTEIRRSCPGVKFAGSFSMPVDPDPEMRSLMYPGYQERADLTTSTGAGAIFTVPDLPLIDLLRAKLVLGRLGATFLTEMPGPFGIPRATAAASTQWIQEGSNATPDTPQLDQVDFTPSIAVDLTNISRKFLASNSVMSERFVIDQATTNLGVEMDRVGLNGLGSSSYEPLGLFQSSAIQSASSALAIGASGGPLTFDNLTQLEESVSIANADVGNLGWVTTPQVRRSLRKTPQLAGGTGGHVCWQDAPEQGVGRILNYRAETTTNVPSNITKGSGTNLSCLGFGNFADMIIATFRQGIDVLVNPFSNQLSAAVLVSLTLACDVQIRRAGSFRVLTDCQAA